MQNAESESNAESPLEIILVRSCP